MDKHVYLNIVENCLMPSRDLLFGGRDCIVQQDNDPKHTAIIIREYWEHNAIDILDWPSQSPDLNPIENLWGILDQKLKHRKPMNETQLFKMLEEEWKALPVSLLTKLVESMPQRCQAVIDVRGAATRY